MSFIELPRPGLSPVSAVSFSEPVNDILLVAAHDRSLRLYSCSRYSLTASLDTPATVLSLGHSPYKTTYAGLLDGTIRHVDFENMAFSAPVVAAKQGARDGQSISGGINCLRPLGSTLFVATSFGGAMLRFDPRMPQPVHTQQLGGKALAMDACGDLVTVALSRLVVEVHDARKWGKPMFIGALGLRFPVLALRALPAGEGYALGSVDGRVSVDYHDQLEAAQARKFAFKCHRERALAGGEDSVYPVTGLRFHPVYGTLFTAGGDGTVCIWNWEKRKRMKLLTHALQLPRAVSHMDISGDGTYMAVSIEDDSYLRASGEQPVLKGGRVLIRSISEVESKPKT